MVLSLGNLELGVEAETGQRGAEQHSHIAWASISIRGSESCMEEKVMGSQKQEFSCKGFFFFLVKRTKEQMLKEKQK